MNEQLQTLLDSIQQNKNLSDEEKADLLKTLKAADKELEIANFKLERTEKVKRTTTILLEETIEELEQKRKVVEEQVREAQIEAALERVRARTMAMQQSDELGDVIKVVFREALHLGFGAKACDLVILDKETGGSTFWISGELDAENDETVTFKVPRIEHSHYNTGLKAWESQEAVRHTVLEGDFCTSYMLALTESAYDSQIPENVKGLILSLTYIAHTEAYMRHGYFRVASLEPLSEENAKILQRFARVFEQTYTRFLDLLKAEAQAREAQIEAALERVRSRSMAMHKSDELQEVINRLIIEIQSLGVQTNACYIVTDLDKDITKGQYIWVQNDVQLYAEKMYLPYLDHPMFHNFYNAWKDKTPFYTETFTKKEKNRLFNHFFKHSPQLMAIPDERKRYVLDGPGFPRSVMINKNTAFVIQKYKDKPFEAEDINIQKRFGQVFEQTYTRFLDLKKAEAQAREAQIEAALERVRSKAMAMQSSDNLALTVDTFFSELHALKVTPHRCGVGIINPELQIADIQATTATYGNKFKKIAGKLKLSGHPVLDGVFENWKQQKEYHPVLYGKEILDYYKVMNPQVAFPDFSGDAIQYGYYFFFKEGGVFAWTNTELSERDLQIFRRFTSVLSLTYRRFMDLQEAEARAREAEQEASLDRVRAEIASMRTADDLQRITPVIWQELTVLGVPFFRCGIFIFDEATELTHAYLSTPSGEAVAALHMKFDSTTLVEQTVLHWREQKVYGDEWDKEQFTAWTQSLIKQGLIDSPKKYQAGDEAPEKLVLQFIPFTQGMLYIGSKSALSENEIELGRELAKAFGIAYARYDDFQSLEAAKADVDAALDNLKKTQGQLIQAEKMASLGQLTAGIAHEIKNPLNFVNNFSELSKELVQELKEELEKNSDKIEKGDANYILEILADLEQNSQKINEHGKRADSIVKGMLQHSRGTSGERQEVDINAMLEESLNLAYHGMRARDTSFNTNIENNFDTNIDKIQVVPQNISRVFLNIITNSFYATHEKQKQGKKDFSPTLIVSTKQADNKVEIRIRDNGSGIPEEIREKIFQPFFTTKPTGQGTGLGLSISYDIIVQEHNGEIRVDSKEGEFTEFVISLPR